MESKKTYQIPTIEIIPLDNAISLQLESDPPILPGETNAILPDNFINNPYRSFQA